jgi:hypothetical protein
MRRGDREDQDGNYGNLRLPDLSAAPPDLTAKEAADEIEEGLIAAPRAPQADASMPRQDRQARVQRLVEQKYASPHGLSATIALRRRRNPHLAAI